MLSSIIETINIVKELIKIGPVVEDCNSRPVLGEFQSPVSLHSYHENFIFVSINFR